MTQNPFLLAADNPAALITLLESSPTLATTQDETGYSLLHAAASYNHHDLIRTLITTHHVPPAILDSDGETPLFVTETPETAALLLALGVPLTHRNHEEQTAAEKIEAEGDFPEVAEFLKKEEAVVDGETILRENGMLKEGDLPGVPEGMKVTVGSIAEEELGEADPVIKEYIERLSKRADFETPEVQAEVREVVRRLLAGEDVSDIIGAEGIAISSSA